MRQLRVLLPSTVLALVMAGVGLISLRGYILSYHLPVQNWFPQGSFHEVAGRPYGWLTNSKPEPKVLTERVGNSPVRFLRFDIQNQVEPVEAWSQVTLGPGWRSLHVSAWYRSAQVGLEIAGRCEGAEMNSRIILPPTGDLRWHCRETVWRIAPKSREVELRVIARGESGLADVAEVMVWPSYLNSDLPTH